MRWYKLLTSSCVLASIHTAANADSAQDTFSTERIEEFFNVFVCEEKALLTPVNLSSPCSHTPLPPPPAPGPPIPPPPTPSQMLPVTIINNSNSPPDLIYLVITGKTPDVYLFQSFVNFSEVSNGIGELSFASSSVNGLQFTQKISAFPTTGENTNQLYLPQIDSGVFWFSVGYPLSMPVNAPNNIVNPAFLNPVSSDPNYQIPFNTFEINYVQNPPAPAINMDATSVDLFTIPLFGSLTPFSSMNGTCGYTASKTCIIEGASAIFSTNCMTLLEQAQWMKLFLTAADGSILRLVSPGDASTDYPTAIFDANYLDNEEAYGYSYIADIWSGPGSFYKMNPLVVEALSGNTYTGTVQTDNTIYWQQHLNPAIGFTFSAPFTGISPSEFTTSGNIFSGVFLAPTGPIASGDDWKTVSQVFEAAIITGFAPTSGLISLATLTASSNLFYTINPNLSVAGLNSGPWYDLYSKALHTYGVAYTWAFDDLPLFPVLVAGPFQMNTGGVGGSQLTITIGNATNDPCTN